MIRKCEECDGHGHKAVVKNVNCLGPGPSEARIMDEKCFPCHGKGGFDEDGKPAVIEFTPNHTIGRSPAIW